MKHYLQTTDEHFAAAAVAGPKSDTSSDTANTRNVMQSVISKAIEAAHSPDNSNVCVSLRDSEEVGDEGLEPPTSTL